MELEQISIINLLIFICFISINGEVNYRKEIVAYELFYEFLNFK